MPLGTMAAGIRGTALASLLSVRSRSLTLALRLEDRHWAYWARMRRRFLMDLPNPSKKKKGPYRGTSDH